MKAGPAVILLGFAWAGLVGVLGGGVDSASGVCDAGDQHGPGCNPDVGKILGRCVVLDGIYLPSACVKPETGEPVPGAVPATELTSAGEFGGRAVGGSLSMEEVERLWVSHGGRPDEAHLAAAVATAESGRRPLAENVSNSDGSVDRGLFQMNSIHGKCSTFDLDENVRCAVQLRNSARGWNHWVAYDRDRYQRYL